VFCVSLHSVFLKLSCNL